MEPPSAAQPSPAHLGLSRFFCGGADSSRKGACLALAEEPLLPHPAAERILTVGPSLPWFRPPCALCSSVGAAERVGGVVAVCSSAASNPGSVGTCWAEATLGGSSPEPALVLLGKGGQKARVGRGQSSVLWPFSRVVVRRRSPGGQKPSLRLSALRGPKKPHFASLARSGGFQP